MAFDLTLGPVNKNIQIESISCDDPLPDAPQAYRHTGIGTLVLLFIIYTLEILGQEIHLRGGESPILPTL